MKPAEIEELIRLCQDTDLGGDVVKLGGHCSAKARFKDLGAKYLKALAAKRGLAKHEYEVGFNPGGPGVAGEATLKSTRFFVQIGVSWCGILYRRCDVVQARAPRGKATIGFRHAEYGNNWFDPQLLADMDAVLALLARVEVA